MNLNFLNPKPFFSVWRNTKKDLQCLISMLVVYLVGPAIYYVAAALVVAHLNGLETTTSVVQEQLGLQERLLLQQRHLGSSNGSHSFKNALRRGMFTYKVQIKNFFFKV